MKEWTDGPKRVHSERKSGYLSDYLDDRWVTLGRNVSN